MRFEISPQRVDPERVNLEDGAPRRAAARGLLGAAPLDQHLDMCETAVVRVALAHSVTQDLLDYDWARLLFNHL